MGSAPDRLRALRFPAGDFAFVRERLTQEQVSLLTYNDSGDPANVQLMDLYQPEGRQADATIVVFRENGRCVQGKRLLGKGCRAYARRLQTSPWLLTRARKRTVVLIVGTELPSLVYPLTTLASA